jgi:6-phosphofructokinase 1
MTSERWILRDHLERGIPFETNVRMAKDRSTFHIAKNRQDELGLFRSRNSRKAVISDSGFLDEWKRKGLVVPSFIEAGPRPDLRFDPQKVQAAIVTTGGLAPGLHCVIHSIVKRHCHAYQMDEANGRIYGVYNSFKGLCHLADNLTRLDSRTTEEWLDQGGSKLGIVRYLHEGRQGDDAIASMAKLIAENLRHNRIDILYVIGGDGSLRVAHQIALQDPTRSVVVIPKTMDNDILWVWQSFGFDTAVEQATRVINTLRSEAEATRRIALIQLFGAESGFVAANAALASGHVDAVLIPEVIKLLSPGQAESYLRAIIEHIEDRVERDRRHDPHAVVVVAEGVGTYLEAMEVCLEGVKVKKTTFISQLTSMIRKAVQDAHGESVPVFENEPRHYIRSVPANAHDQIYCERLGALAVDSALAGFTDCMISQWLTEFVLVPMGLATRGQKSIPVNGMFWKQVVSSTGQPLSPAEHVAGDTAV